MSFSLNHHISCNTLLISFQLNTNRIELFAKTVKRYPSWLPQLYIHTYNPSRPERQHEWPAGGCPKDDKCPETRVLQAWGGIPRTAAQQTNLGGLPQPRLHHEAYTQSESDSLRVPDMIPSLGLTSSDNSVPDATVALLLATLARWRALRVGAHSALDYRHSASVSHRETIRASLDRNSNVHGDNINQTLETPLYFLCMREF